MEIEGVKCKVRQAMCKRTRSEGGQPCAFIARAFSSSSTFLAKKPNTLVLWAGFHTQHISGGQRRVGKSRFVSAWEGFDSCRAELGPI